jgi:hypothetical protein
MMARTRGSRRPGPNAVLAASLRRGAGSSRHSCGLALCGMVRITVVLSRKNSRVAKICTV